jgi:hypothetical protein
MAPIVTVVGCVLIVAGLWASMVSLHRSGHRF